MNMPFNFRITYPKGYDKLYRIPAPVNQGFLLQVSENTQEHLLLNIRSDEYSKDDLVSLVVYLRDEVWFYVTKTLEELQTFSVPISKLPLGIAKITVFDKNNTHSIGV